MFGVLLASCSGTTGSPGPAGTMGTTGAQGPTATGSALNISTATSITSKILSVAISGPPIVKFQLTDQNGAFLQGLPAADLGLTIAQLVPDAADGWLQTPIGFGTWELAGGGFPKSAGHSAWIIC